MDEVDAWRRAAEAARRAADRALPGPDGADATPASLEARVAALADALVRERAAADRLRREVDRLSRAGRKGFFRRVARRLLGLAGARGEEPPLEALERGRGGFDRVDVGGGEMGVSGWLLLPDREFSSFRLFVDGRPAGETEAEYREDIARDYPWIPHATFTGFRFRAPAPKKTRFRLDVAGHQHGQPVARLSSLGRADVDDVVPAPPPALMERVAATSDPRFFRLLGRKSYGEFLEAIERHRGVASVRRMLDWGCGPGRVTAHFLLEHPSIEVHGCDVDREAVEWARAHLPRGRFETVGLSPPAPYEDGAFDVVIAFSVFTHLARDAQDAWLAEIKRLLAPGGLLLASVQGEFAAWFAFPYAFRHATAAPGEERRLDDRVARYRIPPELLDAGIYDGVRDDALASVVPEGYYRCTYQTREYTIREWARQLDVVEYVERGVGQHQDLVVMRRRDGGQP